jgi:hypothetical protein
MNNYIYRYYIYNAAEGEEDEETEEDCSEEEEDKETDYYADNGTAPSSNRYEP